jgi:serine/threonine-protein kinase
MLDDRYRIEHLLATGGWGAVYSGTHTTLRKRVAIKVLSPEHSSEAEIERFRREAITASQIGHEGIAQVTDLGTSFDGEPFLVMEYLEGESLASRLRTSEQLAIEDACEIGCSILAPLGAAHRAGIIHRDLKPDNVFLVRQSRGEMVKLLDFGISHVAGIEPELRLTMTGLVLGTPFYMSPEQARGESEITTAADIYAFGVILYEMLVGDVPIRAENYNQLMYRVTIGDFRPPRQRRPTLPAELERIILHAMAQDPAGRPRSASELEDALLAFCRPVFRERASRPISSPERPSASSSPRLPDSVRTVIERSSNAKIEGSRVTSDPDAHPPDKSSQEPAAGAAIALDPAGPPPVIAAGVAQPARTSAALGDSFPTITMAPRRERSRARRILAGIAIVAVSAAAAGALVLRFTDDDASTATATPTRRSPTAMPLSGPVTAEERPTVAPPTAVHDDTPQPLPAITLRLAIEPTDAAITLDGTRVAGTEVVVTKDTALHRLQITAAGYLDYDETIRFDESQRLVVQLRPAASAPRGNRIHKMDRKPERPERPERRERIESRSPYE